MCAANKELIVEGNRRTRECKKEEKDRRSTGCQSSAQRLLSWQRRHSQGQHAIIRHEDDLLSSRRSSV